MWLTQAKKRKRPVLWPQLRESGAFHLERYVETNTRFVNAMQPYADDILYNGKDIENRTWPLPRGMSVGKRIYVHAGKKPRGRYAGSKNRLGAILGEVYD